MIRRCWILLLATAGLLPAQWKMEGREEFPDASPGLTVWRAEFTSPALTAKVTGIAFSERMFSLRVVDNPGPIRLKLAEAAARAGAVAGCNASYFHEDWRPLGLVISDGQQLHGKERAPLLSGILAVRGRKLQLVRSGAFDPDGISQAVQAGPWLIEKNKPIDGLENTKLARRTVVATDGDGQWALLAFSSVSLADAAQILSLPNIMPGWQIRDALNLDGGGSTALWAAMSPGPLSIAESGFVRNFLMVEPVRAGKEQQP